MLRRGGGNLAGDTAQSLFDKLFQGPACAIACQHGQIMNMDICIAVRIGNLLIVNFRQPVIGCNCSRIAQNQTSHGICHRGILLHSPVLNLYIAVDNILIIQNGGLHGAHFFALFTVQDISLCDFLITCLPQHTLYTVLNVLHLHGVVLHLTLKIRRNTQRQQVHNIIAVLHLCGMKRFHNRIINLSQCKVYLFSISFYYLKHLSPSLSKR